jgi:hypothetical protein
MRSLPLYEKDLYVRVQVFDWIYNADDLLNDRVISENGERFQITSWENKIKQAEAL